MGATMTASYLEMASEAALAAGRYLKSRSSLPVEIRSSTGRDVKIDADTESEKILLDILGGKTSFPVFSEESGSREGVRGDCRWVIDPLDGSLNFSRGIPQCCVSVALQKGENPWIGVVYDFLREELFAGIAGEGAWLNGKPIRVSAVSQKRDAVLFSGFPVESDFSEPALRRTIRFLVDFKKVRLVGSAGLSLAYVACGRGDAYHERNIRVWDVAGGLAVLSGAGGKFRVKPDGGGKGVWVWGDNGRLGNE